MDVEVFFFDDRKVVGERKLCYGLISKFLVNERKCFRISS